MLLLRRLLTAIRRLLGVAVAYTSAVFTHEEDSGDRAFRHPGFQTPMFPVRPRHSSQRRAGDLFPWGT